MSYYVKYYPTNLPDKVNFYFINMTVGKGNGLGSRETQQRSPASGLVAVSATLRLPEEMAEKLQSVSNRSRAVSLFLQERWAEFLAFEETLKQD